MIGSTVQGGLCPVALAWNTRWRSAAKRQNVSNTGVGRGWRLTKVVRASTAARMPGDGSRQRLQLVPASVGRCAPYLVTPQASFGAQVGVDRCTARRLKSEPWWHHGFAWSDPWE